MPTTEKIIAVLKACRPYVECCTEPDGLDDASNALSELDALMQQLTDAPAQDDFR